MDRNHLIGFLLVTQPGRVADWISQILVMREGMKELFAPLTAAGISTNNRFFPSRLLTQMCQLSSRSLANVYKPRLGANIHFNFLPLNPILKYFSKVASPLGWAPGAAKRASLLLKNLKTSAKQMWQTHSLLFNQDVSQIHPMCLDCSLLSFTNQ